MQAGVAWCISAAVHMLFIIAIIHNDANPIFSYILGTGAGLLTAAFMFVSYVEDTE